MPKFGVIVRIPGCIMGNTPYVYCMCETKERAESMSKSYLRNHPRCESFVSKISDSARIGDYLHMVEVI